MNSAVELRLVPTPFDLVEDNWRCVVVTFQPEASPVEAATELLDLAREFDAMQFDLEPPYGDSQLKSCVVFYETDLAAETAALLLYRGATYVHKHGIPADDDLVVLSDPDCIWSEVADRL